MRKIEQKMIEAINNKVDNFISGNTSVFFISASESGNPFGSRSEIMLHGNHIATFWHDVKDNQLEVNINTLKRWPSNTTKSRLRALGANITTKNGIVYLNNEAI